jgi:hypothetical protein
VEQPLKYELTLNLKTAKTLGPTILPGVLAIAERGDRTKSAHFRYWHETDMAAVFSDVRFRG